MMDVALDEVLTLTEAARAIAMPRSTAYLEVIRGRLEGRLVGGRFLIRRQDVETYKAARARAKDER